MQHYLSIPRQLVRSTPRTRPTNLFFLLSHLQSPLRPHLQMWHCLSIPPQSQICSSFCLIYKCGTIYQSLPNYNLQILQSQICSSFCPLYKCVTIFQSLPNYKFHPFTNEALFVNSSSITIYKFVLPNIAGSLFPLPSHLQMRHCLSIPPQLQFTNLFFLI